MTKPKSGPHRAWAHLVQSGFRLGDLVQHRRNRLWVGWVVAGFWRGGCSFICLCMAPIANHRRVADGEIDLIVRAEELVHVTSSLQTPLRD